MKLIKRIHGTYVLGIRDKMVRNVASDINRLLLESESKRSWVLRLHDSSG